MGLPDIGPVKAEYTKETANAYDNYLEEEVKKEQEKTQENTQEDLENLKILTISKAIQENIYNSNLTISSYQFTNQDSYTETDFNDKTDTYVNMNSSFRYIRYNIDGAGLLYNQLAEGNDFKKDSPKKVFESIKNRLTQLEFNKKIDGNGKLSTFEIQNDQDMLYAIGFFQSIVETKSPSASKKDFRIGPKTLTALLENNISIHTSNATETTTTINIPKSIQERIDAYDGKWTLELGGQNITDDILKKILPTLQKLPNLNKLDLRNNQITKIEGLDHLTNLTMLSLGNNQITKIEGLENLTNLTTLWLVSNKITKIEGLDQLTNLTTLDLWNNQITKIEGLDTLTNLTDLWLFGNQIINREELKKLKKLTNLDGEPYNSSETTITYDNQNTETEKIDIAAIKTKLSEFDESKVKVRLYSKVEKSDYKKLFDAVVATDDETKIQLALTYMEALINGDQSMAWATDDQKYPGIKTFKIICESLGQNAVYEEVKNRLEGNPINQPIPEENEELQTETTDTWNTSSNREETDQNLPQDEVFTTIDNLDPQIDSNTYSNRIVLTPEEKEIVKDLYQEIIILTNEAEITAKLNEINDMKIIRGLWDVVTKKIDMLEKKGENIEHLKTISKMDIQRIDTLRGQLVEKTENIVSQYRKDPSNFTITTAPLKEEDKAQYLNEKESTIQVFFMVQDWGNDIEKISFDTDGNLLTNEITKDDKTYTIAQSENTITIKEKNTENDNLTTINDEEEIAF